MGHYDEFYDAEYKKEELKRKIEKKIHEKKIHEKRMLSLGYKNYKGTIWAKIFGKDWIKPSSVTQAAIELRKEMDANEIRDSR